MPPDPGKRFPVGAKCKRESTLFPLHCAIRIRASVYLMSLWMFRTFRDDVDNRRLEAHAGSVRLHSLNSRWVTDCRQDT